MKWREAYRAVRLGRRAPGFGTDKFGRRTLNHWVLACKGLGLTPEQACATWVAIVVWRDSLDVMRDYHPVIAPLHERLRVFA